MSLKIAVAGKGGTGKTTLCALIVRCLKDAGKKDILAVDADPNSNLNEILGVKLVGTVGQLVEEFKKDGAIISSGLYKDQLVEMNIHKILIEANGFDLLAMGRGEGPGCYCAANNLFKKYIDMLQQNYDYVVMDNEAGMEHLSRKTTNDVDYLLIVSDPSPRGIMAANRIRELSKELNIKAKETFLIINRVVFNKSFDGNYINESFILDKRLIEILESYNFNLLGIISQDKNLLDLELDGKDIFSLQADSISLNQVKEILNKLKI